MKPQPCLLVEIYFNTYPPYITVYNNLQDKALEGLGSLHMSKKRLHGVTAYNNLQDKPLEGLSSLHTSKRRLHREQT